jgi:hypothetical protein
MAGSFRLHVSVDVKHFGIFSPDPCTDHPSNHHHNDHHNTDTIIHNQNVKDKNDDKNNDKQQDENHEENQDDIDNDVVSVKFDTILINYYVEASEPVDFDRAQLHRITSHHILRQVQEAVGDRKLVHDVNLTMSPVSTFTGWMSNHAHQRHP